MHIPEDKQFTQIEKHYFDKVFVKMEERVSIRDKKKHKHNKDSLQGSSDKNRRDKHLNEPKQNKTK